MEKRKERRREDEQNTKGKKHQEVWKMGERERNAEQLKKKEEEMGNE